MNALRLRNLVLRSRVPSRMYSTHGHGHGPASTSQAHAVAVPAEESFGPGLYLMIAFFPTVFLLNHLSQPSADGTDPWLTQKIAALSYNEDLWATRNDIFAKASEEAAKSRLMLLSQEKAYAYHIRDVESLFAGSMRCSPPSLKVNLDKVRDHYHAKFHENENRKALALAQAAAANAKESKA